MKYMCSFTIKGALTPVEAENAEGAAVIFAEENTKNVVKQGDDVTVYVEHAFGVAAVDLECIRTFKVKL